MSIVTKTGDKGTTATLQGKRVLKSSNIIELNGEVDELNASIGFLSSLIKENENLMKTKAKDFLEKLIIIQNNLYYIGSEVSSNFKKDYIMEKDIILLEEEIKTLESFLPPQTGFILFTGLKEATFAQMVRTQTRKAERQFIRYLNEEEFSKYPLSYKYINRLSDYIFLLGRSLNYLLDVTEDLVF